MNKKRELIEIDKEQVTESTVPLQGSVALDAGPFCHGTKVDLKPGDLLEPGYSSNYGGRKKATLQKCSRKCGIIWKNSNVLALRQ